jgi:nitrite reductase/ring-hydroxylating ferredoxin subunit
MVNPCLRRYRTMESVVKQTEQTDTSQNRIPDLIRDLSHRNEDVRWAAASALARIGTAAVDPLVAALDDKDSVVRLRAAWALGQIGDGRPVEKLILALRDGDWSVRMRAAEALGKLRVQRATGALLLLLRDKNADVRRHVIAALTKIADPASADRLGVALKDADWRVRMGAALALSAIGDAKSLAYLKTASCDENEYVRVIARAVSNTDTGESCTESANLGYEKDLPPGSMKARQAGDEEILLVNLENRIYALNNTCTHHGCRLSEGTLEGGTVRCPCHGSVFNIKTGEVVEGPAKTPERVYAIAIEKGEIRFAL